LTAHFAGDRLGYSVVDDEAYADISPSVFPCDGDPPVTASVTFFRRVTRESLGLYWTLFKIMVPVMIAVKIAVELGLVGLLSAAFEPFMNLVGLPAEMGLVWATACLVNIYGGSAALLGVLPDAPLTVAQMTVICSMMLAAHGLPIEQRVCQKAGASFVVTTLMRLLAGLAYGALLTALYSSFDLFQQPVEMALLPAPAQEPGVLPWLISSAQSLGTIFFIIFGLIFLLRVMDVIGLTAWLTKALSPLLRLMGIGPEATPLTMVGVLLGLSYGGGLIIRDSRAGTLPMRDTFLAIAFLAICHSLIEDTLFMMALGAHWSGVLIGRFVFSIVVMAFLAPLVRALPEPVFRRWLFPGARRVDATKPAVAEA
jgi:hypothetical protein